MLDVFVGEELKPKLFPIMDEMKVDDKLAKLRAFYPPEDFESYEDLLLQIQLTLFGLLIHLFIHLRKNFK